MASGMKYVHKALHVTITMILAGKYWSIILSYYSQIRKLIIMTLCICMDVHYACWQECGCSVKVISFELPATLHLEVSLSTIFISPCTLCITSIFSKQWLHPLQSINFCTMSFDVSTQIFKCTSTGFPYLQVEREMLHDVTVKYLLLSDCLQSTESSLRAILNPSE